MDINEMKLGDVVALVNSLKGGVEENKKHPAIGKYVVARCYAAGVHVGVLRDYDFKTRHATLTESRRIWSWEGAFTLNAVANDAPTGGKISQEVDSVTVSQVEEIIPCTEKAEKALRKVKAHTP